MTAPCTTATSMGFMYRKFPMNPPKLLLSISVHAHILSDQQRSLHGPQYNMVAEFAQYNTTPGSVNPIPSHIRVRFAAISTLYLTSTSQNIPPKEVHGEKVSAMSRRRSCPSLPHGFVQMASTFPCNDILFDLKNLSYIMLGLSPLTND